MKKSLMKRILLSVVLWMFGLFWFSPVLWMLSTSLKHTQTAVVENPPHWIPREPTLENYRLIFSPASGIDVKRGILNSLNVAFWSIVGTLGVSIPAAYALSRLKFKGRNTVFWSYVAILAFPGALFLIPNYFIIYKLGLMDNMLALIIPGLGSTFGVFLLRQYMLGIPQEIEEAAWLDGCSRLRFLIVMVIPFISPAIIVLSLMTFLASWNSFLWPLLVLNNPAKLTLPLAIVRFSAGWNDPFRGIGTLMAGAFITVAPTLFIFVVFNKYLMQGIALSSGKD